MASKWQGFVEHCREIKDVILALRNLLWILTVLFALVVLFVPQCHSTLERVTSIWPQANSLPAPIS